MFEKTYKLMIVGASGAGKTSLCMRILENHFDEERTTTYGLSIYYYLHQKQSYILMDPGGTGRSHHLVREFLPQVDAVLLLQNSENYEETEQGHSDRWLVTIRRYNTNAKVFLCTTKADLMSEDKKKLLPRLVYNEEFTNLGFISNKTDESLLPLLQKITAKLKYRWWKRFCCAWCV